MELEGLGHGAGAALHLAVPEPGQGLAHGLGAEHLRLVLGQLRLLALLRAQHLGRAAAAPRHQLRRVGDGQPEHSTSEDIPNSNHHKQIDFLNVRKL